MTALEEATKENGDVMTSSPAPTPAARSARCRPAVPLDTALACATPRRAAKRRSNSGTRGPSDSWPERRTSRTARSSASPMTGRASGITRARARAGSGAGAGGMGGVLEHVDERLPRGRDDVLRHADGAPRLVVIGRVDEHA